MNDLIYLTFTVSVRLFHIRQLNIYPAYRERNVRSALVSLV